ncbi:MAG: flavodoxin family protein [Spirochaetes bacterium]|nr:flavodoxin family protein [Spirochaetota bacterium]
MTAKKALVTYSSKTGNTRKLAAAIYQRFSANGIEARIAPVEEAPQPQEGEVIFAGYWVDKGTADQKFLDYIAGLKGRKIGLFGTLGAYPDSEHARDCAEKLEALVRENNVCLGTFLCQGKIDPALSEMFKKFPPGHPHFMDAERIKRHEDAAKHPDAADLEAAAESCAAMLERAFEGGP